MNTATYVGNAAPDFGVQSLRFSNLCTNGAFGSITDPAQMYSPPITPAGQGEPNTVFTYQFSFIPTTTSYQNGLYVSVSPDDGSGGRMLRVDLTSEPFACGNSTSCVLVSVVDAPASEDGYPTPHAVGLLDPSTPHTVKVTMKFNPGADNDLTRVSVDGADSGQCFTSWESYYSRWQADIHPTPPVSRVLEFRARVPGFTGTNAGYLFDNVSYSSSDGPGPDPCPVDIEKQPDSPTVTAGGLAGYTLTVRNHSKMTERNLLLCDHLPRQTTFVSARRRLRRVGSKRCLFIPSIGPGKSTSVHVSLRVDSNALPGNLENVADITPESPPGVPVVPPAALVDLLPPNLPPAAASATPRPIRRVRAIVRVVRAIKAVLPPPVTG